MLPTTRCAHENHRLCAGHPLFMVKESLAMARITPGLIQELGTSRAAPFKFFFGGLGIGAGEGERGEKDRRGGKCASPDGLKVLYCSSYG